MIYRISLDWQTRVARSFTRSSYFRRESERFFLEIIDSNRIVDNLKVTRYKKNSFWNVWSFFLEHVQAEQAYINAIDWRPLCRVGVTWNSCFLKVLDNEVLKEFTGAQFICRRVEERIGLRQGLRLLKSTGWWFWSRLIVHSSQHYVEFVHC